MSRKSDVQIHANVLLRSQTGLSLVTDYRQLSRSTLTQFKAAEGVAEELTEKLEKVGFNVIVANQFGLSISGPEELYKEYFKTGIVQRPLDMFMGGKKSERVIGFFMEESPQIHADVKNLLESVYIPRIGTFYAGEGPMPTPGYYHLRPPDDIVQLTNADHAHSRGFRGNGVRVAMVDSGFRADHDYYNGRGYNITVMAAVGSTNQDEVGHGTGIASNLLAIAPDSDFLFVKMFDGANWGARAGFLLAVNNGARVITNSWGQAHDPLLEADIINAVNNGITVIFACGNGGAVGWPGCMDEVISVGGAYPKQDGTWEASSYASSGINALVPGRHCPDLSAIVGHAPNGIFIMMPTQAGATFDAAFGGGVFPNGDETGVADGWLCASGTSSAAPMVAGAATLLLEASTTLTPADIQQALEDACLDVTTGNSASGEGTAVGPDDATGAGMIDIGAAIDHVAPVSVCHLAPLTCARAPIVACRIAPMQCLRAPNVCQLAPAPCLRAPLQCKTGPGVPCSRAPILQCTRAPLVACRLAPAYRNCTAGPVLTPTRPDIPRERAAGNKVPIIIMVREEEVPAFQAEYGAQLLTDQDAYSMAMAAAEEAYYATLEQLGMDGEYDGFPSANDCVRGPFKPGIS
jgi:hypothetical protein